MDEPVTLRIRSIAIDTLRESVVLFVTSVPGLAPERLKGFRKVQLAANGAVLTASILIVDDPALLGESEVD